MNWTDGLGGATPVSAANLGKLMVTADAATAGTPTGDALRAAYATYLTLAANPDTIIVGTITRDGNGAATSAGVVWPDGTTGTYTADTVSTAFPGAVDAYHITYAGATTKTYTQTAVTRDATTGAVTVRPAITVA
jgi:hypothetical protein